MEFTHVSRNVPSTFTTSMNPLTGNWLQSWKVGEMRQYDYSNKRDAEKMVNDIIKKSAEKNLPCKVTIQPRTVLRDTPKAK